VRPPRPRLWSRLPPVAPAVRTITRRHAGKPSAEWQRVAAMISLTRFWPLGPLSCSPAKPVTLVRIRFKTVTRFKTVIKTVIPNRVLARGKEAEIGANKEPPFEMSDWTSAPDELLSRDASPRHLCPVCKPGATSSFGSPCCKKRKTITRTLKRTRTLVRTRTKTVAGTPPAVQSMSGLLFLDINGNGNYDPGLDSPMANAKILAVKPATGSRINDVVVIGSTTTSGNGSFVMFLMTSDIAGLSSFSIVLQSNMFFVLAQVLVGKGNFLSPFVFVPAPISLPRLSTEIARTKTLTATGTKTNLATQTTTLVQGRTSTLSLSTSATSNTRSSTSSVTVSNFIAYDPAKSFGSDLPVCHRPPSAPHPRTAEPTGNAAPTPALAEPAG
jgi:hypothetical protein